MAKPVDLFDRDAEWDDLERFVRSSAPGARVGMLYGRRRVGKSFLLRRLAQENQGIYHMAIEEEGLPALERFAATAAAHRRLPAGSLRFADWSEALRFALAEPSSPARTTAGRPLAAPRLLVLDELPYLLAQPLGRSVPSVLQTLVDESRSDARASASRLIVCGSALSVMSELLSGSKPLRGRAELDLLLRPFDFRTVAEYFGIADPLVAFRLYAIFGGTPGYRDLLADASPQTLADLDELLLATVLNPSHALFGESGYLLREDPRITDRALYYSVLAAVADGASTPSAVGAHLGRDQRSLGHPLDVLVTAGFLVKDDDVLAQRRPVLRVADPIVRFHELVVTPRLASFEDRRARPAWQDAQAAVRSGVYGPAFEGLAREWTRRYASQGTLGGRLGLVGSSVVNDREGRSKHELDVVALAAGSRVQSKDAQVLAVGEAKDSDRPRGGADLARLDRIRALLVARGVDAAGARLLVFGRSGFDGSLVETASRRQDVELVDLERIRYGD